MITDKDWSQRWPNFPRHEIECPCCQNVAVEPVLMDRVQSMRNQRGAPIIVSSGYRCLGHNKAIGSTSKNHVLGLALDLAAEDLRTRFQLVESAISHGFRRIGIYTKHIHIDINTAEAPDVLWLGA